MGMYRSQLPEDDPLSHQLHPPPISAFEAISATTVPAFELS
jgi:hypothetical protein